MEPTAICLRASGFRWIATLIAERKAPLRHPIVYHLPSPALMRDALISYCNPRKVEANTNSYKWERVRICSLDDEYDRDTKPLEINGDRSG
jgi:hypothetical protein